MFFCAAFTMINSQGHALAIDLGDLERDDYECSLGRRGWKIFEDSGTQRIGRTDGPTAFATDADAANHVKQCAQGRDGLALRAIAYLKRVNSPDVGQYGLDKLG
jgi:hypothetical protein